MTIRRLTSDEIDDMFALSQFAFQYELSDKELEERRSREKPEETWGYFQDGRLAAKMKIIPLEIFIHGQLFSMGGVSSVATWPEYRRQGMVKQLLTHGLRVMKESGQSVSFLHPFSFAYYRKYGWEHAFDEKKYTVELEQLPQFGDTEGTIERKKRSDWPLLNEMYEQYAVKYNGTLKRNEEWWLHRSVIRDKKMTIAVYYNRENIPRGYIVYKVKDKEMEIDEFIHLDEESRRGLWRYIANHDSMLKKVILIAPVDDALPFLLANPRIKQEIIPYFMGRIVDAAVFLEQFPFIAMGKKESFVLHLEDWYAPWNTGTYVIQVDGDGKADVTVYGKTEANANSEAETGLSCDIQTLSAMLLGYKRPSYLHKIGRLKGDANDVQGWESLIPQKTPYLPDFF